MFDDEYISQRNIEKDLFEALDNNLDKSFSLLKSAFVVIGFYSVVFFNIYNKFDIDVILQSAPYPPYSGYSIKLCFVMIFLIFLSSFIGLKTGMYKFVKTGHSIQYLSGHELEKNNINVFYFTFRPPLKN